MIPPGMTRLGALVVIVAAVALALSGVAGSASTGSPSPKNAGASWHSYSSQRYGFSLSLPPGWQQARARLVPKLLSPLEIFSVATSTMPVGGGGNCGRYPIAAIERMQTGDALISVQEYATNNKMRARIGAASAPPPLARLKAKLRKHPEQIDLRKELHARGGERIPPASALWSATLPFTAQDRWFDALIFVKGHPTPARVSQIQAILARLSFEAGSRVKLPSN